MMPYFCAVFGLSSTLSLTILTLPPSEPAISSSAGAIMRHGPHHSAQKSTTTGSFALSTSVSKSASETLPTPMGDLVLLGAGESGPRKESERMDATPERQGGSRGGEAGDLGIQEVGRKFHQIRHIGPDQHGTHRPVRIELAQHRAIERELAHIARRHRGRRARR